jgi:hypothetical protein
MSDEPQKRSRACWAVLVILFLAYLLSIGPVYWLANTTRTYGIIRIYAPVLYLTNKSAPATQALRWYVRLFTTRG